MAALSRAHSTRPSCFVSFNSYINRTVFQRPDSGVASLFPVSSPQGVSQQDTSNTDENKFEMLPARTPLHYRFPLYFISLRYKFIYILHLGTLINLFTTEQRNKCQKIKPKNNYTVQFKIILSTIGYKNDF